MVEVGQESPKLRTYRKVKNKLQFEEYLNNDDQEGRRILARIRSGTNCLRIETGRWEGLRREQRICWFGCPEIEDEYHFLIKCNLYSDLRQELKENIGEEEFHKRGLKMLLGEGSEEEIKKVIKFIKMASARRKRIIEFKD